MVKIIILNVTTVGSDSMLTRFYILKELEYPLSTQYLALYIVQKWIVNYLKLT